MWEKNNNNEIKKNEIFFDCPDNLVAENHENKNNARVPRLSLLR